jgi:hypothetical protein
MVHPEGPVDVLIIFSHRLNVKAPLNEAELFVITALELVLGL